MNEVPLKYQFVGTNDSHCNEYSPWTILCEDLEDDELIKYRYFIKLLNWAFPKKEKKILTTL